MTRKFRPLPTALILVASLGHTFSLAHATEESGMPAEPPRRTAEGQRALPEHFAAMRAPAWADDASLVADTTRELINACTAGKQDVVKALLAKGALANAGDERGQRPLIAAVAGGHAEIVRLLLQAGASPNVKGLQGRNPLGLAAASGQEFIARQLLQAGADINARSDNRATALHEAVRFKQTDIMRLLLAADPYPENFDREGLHPLALAAALGNLPAIKTLLEAGVDPDQPDKARLTALYWARRYQQTLAEAYLLEHGATRDAWPIIAN